MKQIKYKFLTLIASIPDQFIPACVQRRITDYAEKELQKAKTDVIRLRWQQASLENRLKEFKAKH